LNRQPQSISPLLSRSALSRRSLLAAALVLPASAVVARTAYAVQEPADDAAVVNTLLAVEHAAVYDLAAVGAHLAVAARDRTRARYDEHRVHRDALIDEVSRLGGTPVVSEPAYRLPGPVSARSAPATLVLVEQAVVAAYHDALARISDPAARTLCAAYFVHEARHLAESRVNATTTFDVRLADAFVTGA
jgi:hypothetical protein